MVIAFLIIALLYGGIHFYLARRMEKGLSALYPIKKPVFYTVFAILSLGAPLNFLFPKNNAFSSAVGLWGSVWLGVFVYLLLFTVFADLLWLVFRFTPLKKSLNNKARFFRAAAVLLFTLAVTVTGLLGGAKVEKTSYDLGGHGEEIKIALMSDIHLGAAGSLHRLEQAVFTINEMDADLVCLAGDIFNDDFHSVNDPHRVKELLLSLCSRYGVYAVLGNHDSGETLSEMRAFLEEAGVKLLLDEAITIEEKFVLAGRLDLHPIGKTEGLKRGNLEKFLPETSLPVIVMDHNPKEASLYGENISLVLSGHTHKGQIFPGSLITGAMYTVDYGVYQKDTSSPHVVVSSGTGLWGPPMRVGTKNEVVEILFSLEQ